MSERSQIEEITNQMILYSHFSKYNSVISFKINFPHILLRESSLYD